MNSENRMWDWEIGASTSDWNWKIQELWGYRHLLSSLVQRTFLLNYQQTVLGPFWTLLQPLLTLITYMLVFGKLVGLSTGSVPPILFYFSGIILWTFFSDCFLGTTNTFRENMHLFSKVYFPRIIMPVSVAVSNFIKLLIQLSLLFLIILYYRIFENYSVPVTWYFATFPFLVFLVGALALGLGLTCSIITVKYRDLVNIINIGIRLLMFVTPVIYPLSSIKAGTRWVMILNPLTPLFEYFRFCLFGEGIVSPSQMLFSVAFTAIVLVSALISFNKKGNKLLDIV